MSRKTKNGCLENIPTLLNEIVEDNTALVGSLNRVVATQETLRSDLVREMGLLRDDFAGALAFRALKDLCTELISPLAAMEAMLQQADFADTQVIRGHVESLVITMHSVLSRMGAEKISIAPGEELFIDYGVDYWVFQRTGRDVADIADVHERLRVMKETVRAMPNRTAGTTPSVTPTRSSRRGSSKSKRD